MSEEYSYEGRTITGRRTIHHVEIISEPTPPPRPGSRLKGGAHIKFVEEATGKVVNEITTADYVVNETRPREESKY